MATPMATTTTTTTSPPPPPSLLSALHATGFVKISNLLSAPEVAVLRAACDHAAALARAGRWPFVRTLPKQFPPWPRAPPVPPDGIWGVQHLLHPDMPGRDVFAASYFHPRVLEAVGEILGVDGVGGAGGEGESGDGVGVGDGDGDGDEMLVMELYNLLVRPDMDFELRWHRDDVPPTASAAEEEAALGVAEGGSKPAVYSHTQWNLALEPDDSLIVVPRTHKRARTDTERGAGVYDVLPEQIIVHLEPGDVVFYDNDILHRGKYSAGKARFTLHGSMGKKGFTQKRARNVLQHGVGEWIENCDVSLGDPLSSRRAKAMRVNLLEMGSEKEVGFSQYD